MKIKKRRIEDVKDNVVVILEKVGEPRRVDDIRDKLERERRIGRHIKMTNSRLSQLMSKDKQDRFIRFKDKNSKNYLWWLNEEKLEQSVE